MRQEVFATINAFSSLAIACLLAVLVYQNAQQHTRPDLSTPFQAIQMANGQIFLGRLEGAGTAFPSLREAYTFQTRTNPETKQVTNTLVRRSQEANEADAIVLNGSQILTIEPVRPGSNIDKMIQQSRSATPAPKK